MSEALVPEKQKQKLKEPSKYAVVVHNDDFTPMEFVVVVLTKVLKVSLEDAERMTFEIHLKGKTIHGAYTRDVAETKATLICQLAQENEHPLKADVEKLDE